MSFSKKRTFNTTWDKRQKESQVARKAFVQQKTQSNDENTVQEMPDTAGITDEFLNQEASEEQKQS